MDMIFILLVIAGIILFLAEFMNVSSGNSEHEDAVRQCEELIKNLDNYTESLDDLKALVLKQRALIEELLEERNEKNKE